DKTVPGLMKENKNQLGSKNFSNLLRRKLFTELVGYPVDVVTNEFVAEGDGLLAGGVERIRTAAGRSDYGYCSIHPNNAVKKADKVL
ncbi:MAG: hypothetical protein Q7U85_05240, partial [Rhodocyclaceae bacterium]|nr:hypothetical protein [Rhodocyclaceae bacterium]